MLWTLLIFIACFTPAKDIPKVDVPLIDKWTHFVLFGVFTLLWLCVRPSIAARRLFSIWAISIAVGAFIELMQGALTFLGRSMELLDAVADGVGGILGVLLFWLFYRWANK